MNQQDRRFTLAEKVEYATDKLSAARAALERANAQGDAAFAMGGGIPGFGGSGSQKAANQVRSALNSSQRAWKEATERVDYWTDKLARLEHRQSEEQRARLGRDDIKGATHVRTQHGWHKVARVNAKTVSVETGYSWVARYEFDKIQEVRMAASA